MVLFRKVYNFIKGQQNWFRTWFLRKSLNSCGKAYFWGKVDVINPRNLTIGDNCTINHGCYLNAFNPINIGNDVTLSANVSLISTGIDIKSWIEGKKCHLYNNGIIIGDHVWVGAGAQILNNVHIKGPYVVVAAGAIVNKDINESFCVVGGCPAKVIKYLR